MSEIIDESAAIAVDAWGRVRHPGSRCQDYDDDCGGVPCKLACWLYDPERDICPYLDTR